jgi:hypothetical protein
MSASNSMNALIAETRRARATGLMDRLRGTPPLDEDRQERLRTQLANYEHALKMGDEIGAAVADTAIDKLLDESRAARQEQGQEPPAGSGFDGGVRRTPGRSRPTPGIHQPSAGEMFLAALKQSAVEQARRY